MFKTNIYSFIKGDGQGNKRNGFIKRQRQRAEGFCWFSFKCLPPSVHLPKPSKWKFGGGGKTIFEVIWRGHCISNYQTCQNVDERLEPSPSSTWLLKFSFCHMTVKWRRHLRFLRASHFKNRNGKLRM